jgi:hypothetical protein
VWDIREGKATYPHKNDKKNKIDLIKAAWTP